MESPIHSSFIPTQQSQSSASDIEYGKSASDIFVLLGLIALVISGAVSAGVFLYHQYAQNDLATKKEQLKLGEKAFSVDAIDQLMRLDTRLTLGEGILSNHTAPSVLFAILQETTLQSIQFTSLEYAHTTPNEITVSMKGKARTVNAIALQANMFSRHAAIKDPIFQINEFTKDAVVFSVNMKLNAEVIRFQSLIQASQNARPRAQQQVPVDDVETGPSFTNQQSGQSPQSAAQTGPGGAQQPQRQQPPARAPQTEDIPDGFGEFSE